MTTRRPDLYTVHASAGVLGVLEVWVAEHPGMAVDVACSLGVPQPDERVGWLIGCDDHQAAGRLVWYLPAEPPEPARVPVQAADDIMDLLWEIAECHGVEAARDYATARGLRPPGDHPEWTVGLVILDDGPPQWVWTDRADPCQIDTTAWARAWARAWASGLVGDGPSNSTPSQAGQEAASTAAENDGGPDMVVIDADLDQRIELWRAHMQGPTAMGACAQRLGLTPPADGQRWQAVVGCVYAVGRWNLYWTTVEEDTAQDWPVEASTVVLAGLRDMLARRSGHQVAEAAIALGVNPPSPVAWEISDQVRHDQHQLRWMPYPGGEITALDWFPEPAQSVLGQILGDGELMVALRFQQDLTPRQRNTLTRVLGRRLAAAQAGHDSPTTQWPLHRAIAVVDYLWGEGR
jgi:hypothetical protein